MDSDKNSVDYSTLSPGELCCKLNDVWKELGGKNRYIVKAGTTLMQKLIFKSENVEEIENVSEEDISLEVVPDFSQTLAKVESLSNNILALLSDHSGLQDNLERQSKKAIKNIMKNMSRIPDVLMTLTVGPEKIKMVKNGTSVKTLDDKVQVNEPINGVKCCGCLKLKAELQDLYLLKSDNIPTSYSNFSKSYDTLNEKHQEKEVTESCSSINAQVEYLKVAKTPLKDDSAKNQNALQIFEFPASGNKNTGKLYHNHASDMWNALHLDPDELNILASLNPDISANNMLEKILDVAENDTSENMDLGTAETDVLKDIALEIGESNVANMNLTSASANAVISEIENNCHDGQSSSEEVPTTHTFQSDERHNGPNECNNAAVTSETNAAVTSETDEVPPETDKVPPETDKVPPETDEVPPETDEIPPETDEIPPETDEIPPETDEIPPETDEVPPETDEVPPETDEITPEAVAVIPETDAGTSTETDTNCSNNKISSEQSTTSHASTSTGNTKQTTEQPDVPNNSNNVDPHLLQITHAEKYCDKSTNDKSANTAKKHARDVSYRSQGLFVCLCGDHFASRTDLDNHINPKAPDTTKSRKSSKKRKRSPPPPKIREPEPVEIPETETFDDDDDDDLDDLFTAFEKVVPKKSKRKKKKKKKNPEVGATSEDDNST